MENNFHKINKRIPSRVMMLIVAMFIVIITFSSPAGWAESAEREIVAVPASGAAPLNVSLSVAPAEGITAYAWDIDDDGTADSQESQLIHLFRQAGVFPVRVELTTADNETLSLTKDISVSAPIQISLTANPSSGVAPLAVQLTAAATGKEPLTYAWDFNGDGTIDSTLQNPATTFEKEGEHQVSLTVTEAGGNKATKNISITALAYEVNLNLTSYFPQALKGGEQEITFILINEGDSSLEEVKAKIIGEGIQHLSSTAIPLLRPGEQDSLTVKVNVLQNAGVLTAIAKIQGKNFPLSFSITSPVQYKKEELQSQLEELKGKLQQQESEYYDKKAQNFLISEIFDSIKSAKAKLQEAQQQIMTGKTAEAKINLDLVSSMIEDITVDLAAAKKQKQTFMMWLKDNALAITAIIAALGTLGGILIKVLHQAKKLGENVKQKITVKRTVTETKEGNGPVKEVTEEVTKETFKEKKEGEKEAGKKGAEEGKEKK